MYYLEGNIGPSHFQKVDSTFQAPPADDAAILGDVELLNTKSVSTNAQFMILEAFFMLHLPSAKKRHPQRAKRGLGWRPFDVVCVVLV
jgi:hypothetical protein